METPACSAQHACSCMMTMYNSCSYSRGSPIRLSFTESLKSHQKHSWPNNLCCLRLTTMHKHILEAELLLHVHAHVKTAPRPEVLATYRLLCCQVRLYYAMSGLKTSLQAMPQIGACILQNLVNNACYAVHPHLESPSNPRVAALVPIPLDLPFLSGVVVSRGKTTAPTAHQETLSIRICVLLRCEARC